MAKNIFKCNTERVELVTIPDRGFLDALFVMTTELFVPEFWAWHVDLVSLTPTWIRWSEKMAYQSDYSPKIRVATTASVFNSKKYVLT